MITTEEKHVLKEKLLQASISKQQLLLDDFKSRIRTLLTNEGLGNEEEYDNNELSHALQKAEEINALNQALEFAKEEMRVLKGMTTQIDFPTSSTIIGAVVNTNHDRFFISVSTEQLTLDGENYVGISTSSPIYLVMKGKTKGQSFSYKGKKYNILDIF